MNALIMVVCVAFELALLGLVFFFVIPVVDWAVQWWKRETGKVRRESESPAPLKGQTK